MKDLADFAYQIGQLSTADLTANALDDAWLMDLSNEELILLIHELVTRLPAEQTEDWYLEPDEAEFEEEWEDGN